MSEPKSTTEHRRRAVVEVLAGGSVAQTAHKYGVSRQTLHRWRSRYLQDGVAGLEDRSRRPHESPARLAPRTEVLICRLRVAHPDWGARRLVVELGRRGVSPVPAHSTVHRALVRNQLVPAASVQEPQESWAQRIVELEDRVRMLAELLQRA